MNILKSCFDRRVLFKLISKQITFDQFITRVNCDTKGVKYYCKDDLLEKGINPEFFENVGDIGDYLKAVHGVESLEQIKPEDITNQCGSLRLEEMDTLSDPKYKKLTET